MNQTIPGIALAVFAAAMIAVGVFSFKKSKTMSSFLLGGRNVGAWMSAFAYGTAYFSAVIFIGYAGKTGWGIGVGGIWVGIGNALLGSLLAWKLLAKRTRRMSQGLNASTMPEFFNARYLSRPMKLFSAVVIFVFLLPYAASVYTGLGYLFNAVFPNLSFVYCMLIIAGLSAFYLVLGGYTATSITDFIQGIIMIFGVIVLVFCIVYNPAVGGIGAGLAKLVEISGEPDLAKLFGGKNFINLISTVLLTSFGTWGLPQMVHKFYAIRDERSIVKGTVISTLFAGLIGIGAYFVGTFGRIYLSNTLPAEGYDKVVPDMLVAALSGNVFSNIVLSVTLLLVLSASMSTLSAVVLTSSSSIAVDILGDAAPNMGKRRQMLIMRSLCFVFVGLSLVLALQKIGFIVALMSFSWGAVSGCFIGPYFWGLYSKKTTKAGAWAGMIGGLGTIVILTAVMTAMQSFDAAKANAPLFGVCAMVVSFAIVPLVSSFTKKYESEHTDKVFGYLTEPEKDGKFSI